MRSTTYFSSDNFPMAKRKTQVQNDTYTPLESYCIGLNEFYRGLRKAGFSVELTLALIIEKSIYPDWLLPGVPNDLEDHEAWEEDED